MWRNLHGSLTSVSYGDRRVVCVQPSSTVLHVAETVLLAPHWSPSLALTYPVNAAPSESWGWQVSVAVSDVRGVECKEERGRSLGVGSEGGLCNILTAYDIQRCRQTRRGFKLVFFLRLDCNDQLILSKCYSYWQFVKCCSPFIFNFKHLLGFLLLVFFCFLNYWKTLRKTL